MSPTNPLRMVWEECCNCHIQFGVTKEFQESRQDDKNSFYCPSGHRMHYTGKTKLKKMTEARNRAEACCATATRERDDYKRRLNPWQRLQFKYHADGYFRELAPGHVCTRYLYRDKIYEGDKKVEQPKWEFRCSCGWVARGESNEAAYYHQEAGLREIAGDRLLLPAVAS